MGNRFGFCGLGLVLLLMSFAAVASAVPRGTLAAGGTISLYSCPSFGIAKDYIESFDGTGVIDFVVADCSLDATAAITTQAGSNITIHGNGVVFSSDNSSHDIIDVGTNATLNVDHATFQNGSYGIGCAGGVCSNKTVNVQASTFVGNRVGVSGSNVSVRDSTAYENTMSGFAGLDLMMVNSTSFGNLLDGVLYNSTGTFVSSTITGNDGDGIAARGSLAQPPIIEATILADNAANCTVAAVDHGLNLSTDASCGFNASSSINLVSATDLALGPLGYYGGPTPTIPLLPNSIAINAIPHNDPPTPSVLCYNTVESRAIQDPRTSDDIVVDQRGVSRVADTACDIGAYEAVALSSSTLASAASAQATDSSVTFPVTVSATCPIADTPCDAPNEGLVTVHVTTTGGTPVGTDATGLVSGGAANVSYTLSDPVPGSYNVTISYHDAAGLYGDSQKATTLTITPGPPSIVTFAPGDTSAEVGTNVTEVASITDANGNAVADGTTVVWAITGPGSSTATSSRQDLTTTGGSATLIYSNMTAAVDTVTVVAGTDPLTASGSASVTWTPGPAASITLEPGNTSAIIGSTVNETATVADRYGNIVSDNTPVTFSVSGANTAAGTVVTSNGQAEFSFSGDVTGVDTVLVTSGTAVPAQAAITWLAPASTARASLTIVNPLGTAIMATVRTSSTGIPSGTLTYHGRTLTLSRVHLTALIVNGQQATLYGTASANGVNVSFRLDASASLRRGTVRLRLSNGYDSGNQPVAVLRVMP